MIRGSLHERRAPTRDILAQSTNRTQGISLDVGFVCIFVHTKCSGSLYGSLHSVYDSFRIPNGILGLFYESIFLHRRPILVNFYKNTKKFCKTILFLYTAVAVRNMAAIAQLVRASDCESEGRGFEPL